jgi:hypothetical protein
MNLPGAVNGAGRDVHGKGGLGDGDGGQLGPGAKRRQVGPFAALHVRNPPRDHRPLARVEVPALEVLADDEGEDFDLSGAATARW